MAPFTLFFGSHHDNLAHLTDAHEDEAPLWIMLLHWLLAIGKFNDASAPMMMIIELYSNMAWVFMGVENAL